MLRSLIGLSSIKYLKNVYMNVILVSIVAVVVPLLLSYKMDESFLNFIILSFVAMLSTAVTELLIGCNKQERAFVLEKVKSIKKSNHDKY